MSYLFNLLFILAAAAGPLLLLWSRSRLPLYWSAAVIVLAILFNAVTPLAVRTVDLNFLADVARSSPALRGYRLDKVRLKQVPMVPIPFLGAGKDYDQFYKVNVIHPWYRFTQFTVTIEYLVKNDYVVAIKFWMNRKESRYFSGLSTGPDDVGGSPYMMTDLYDHRTDR